MRFQGAARKWDSMQSRSFLADDIYYDKKDLRKKRAPYIKETYSTYQYYLFRGNISYS